MDARRRPILPALCLALSLAACAAPGSGGRRMPGSQRTPAHNEVHAAIVDYYATLSARDWEALPDHFWPGATLTTLWAEGGAGEPEVFTVTVDEFVARAPEGPGSQPIFEERPIGAEVRVSGPLAQVWALYEARFGTEDDLMTWRGVDAFTLLLHDGEWRIASIGFAELPEE